MPRPDVSKITFYLAIFLFFIGGAFSFGLYSGVKKTMAYEVVRDVAETVESALKLAYEEASTVTRTHPKHFLQPSRFDGDGVTVNSVAKGADDLILLSGFFHDSNELRLIRRTGELLARWPVKFSEIFPDNSHVRLAPATDWNIDTHGALILPDGTVVFNFEYGGLVAIDRCGQVKWKLALQTHHSIERAEGGGFWVPVRRYHEKDTPSKFKPFETPFNEDTIIKVSDNGKVLQEISVPSLFFSNDLEALITATGDSFVGNERDWPIEIVHLNKVAELSEALSADFSMFEAGDLVLSLRQQNLVMVIDPDTEKVKWWQVGPWIRQHDPEFIPGGKLLVFNNNAYKSTYSGSGDALDPVSNIIEVDPVSSATKTLCGKELARPMFTKVRGKLELTPSGNLMITEFEAGRIFEVNSQGDIVWEFINRYSDDEIAEITEARAYARTYFEVSDWACQ